MQTHTTTPATADTVAVSSGTLFGEFVRAGTMTVSGEEVTGYVVATTVDALRAAPRLPMYRQVAIVDSREWCEIYRKIGFLLGALEGLRWSVEGDARKKIDAIIAAESSPNTNLEPRRDQREHAS